MDAREFEDSSQKIGLREDFWVGAYEHVERVLADMHLLGVTELCTIVSQTTWNTSAGLKWYQWLLPRLAQEINVLPCAVCTFPSLNLAPKTAASQVFEGGANGHSARQDVLKLWDRPSQTLTAVHAPKAYGDFIEVVIGQFGDYFEWIALWDPSAHGSDGVWTLSPQWPVFCETMGVAAYRSRQHGKKTVLSGLSPFEPHCLSLLIELGITDYIDAIGINRYPGAPASPGRVGPP